MPINTTPHLNFRGQAHEALKFYQSAVGGDLTAVTYAQAHNVSDPADADQVMFGQVKATNGFLVMAYDVPTATPFDPGEKAFFVSIRGTTPDEIEAIWTRMKPGSEILQDLAPAAWSPLYGMLKDPFGVTWILDVAVAG